MCTIKSSLMGLILFSGTVSAMVDEPVINVEQIASDLHVGENVISDLYVEFITETIGLGYETDKAIETQFTAYAEDHVSRTDILATNEHFQK